MPGRSDRGARARRERLTRVLFVGDTWQGSSARSMREALADLPSVSIRDIGTDAYIPNHRRLPLRVANRLLRRLQQRELESAVIKTVGEFRPDAVIVYKGPDVDAGLIGEIRSLGTRVANIFPDYSPHAYGRQLEIALGSYDLVISTKPFHPDLWHSVYRYRNQCAFVPHGYDPDVHYWGAPPDRQVTDVALCSSWRPEYQRLMRSFARALGDDAVSVAIAGPGWVEHSAELPGHWQCVGPRVARSYGEFLRTAKIVIAPVNREVVVRGVRQPGDEDTTRTYELAAAHCFFLHQRTNYVATVYDENSEVPFWSDPAELARLVRRWLPDPEGRLEMARRAHARAVPAYSIPARASSVLRHVEALIGREATAGES